MKINRSQKLASLISIAAIWSICGLQIAKATPEWPRLNGKAKSSCGTVDPRSYGEGTFVQYPVYVGYSADRLKSIKREVCADAYVTRLPDGTRAIQLASFDNYSAANDFAFIINAHQMYSWVGKPTCYYKGKKQKSCPDDC